VYITNQPYTKCRPNANPNPNPNPTTKQNAVVSIQLNTGWPKKVSHYRESSLNRIKNRQPG